MKKHITLFCGLLVVITSFTLVIAQNPWDLTDEEMNVYTNSEFYIHAQARRNHEISIPRLSWMSDVVGIGRITNAFNTGKYKWDGSFVELAVDTYWRGDPGTNHFKLFTEDEVQPPVSNTPMVFFLTKYGSMRGLSESKAIIWSQTTFRDMDYFRSVEIQNGYWLMFDAHSWFHINENNTDVVNFASNLVYAANSCDTNSFYRIIRDGYKDAPLTSRIYSDSYGMLINAPRYFDTNFVQNVIWKDRKLSIDVLSPIWFSMNQTHRIELPIEPGTILMVR